MFISILIKKKNRLITSSVMGIGGGEPMNPVLYNFQRISDFLSGEACRDGAENRLSSKTFLAAMRVNSA